MRVPRLILGVSEGGILVGNALGFGEVEEGVGFTGGEEGIEDFLEDLRLVVLGC